MNRRSLAPLSILVAALAACEADVATGAISASIVRLDAHRLAVVDPDVGSVSVVDADGLEALARVEVGDTPRALLLGDGVLYAVVQRSGELVEIAIDDAPRVLRRQAVCAGPRALARAPSGEVQIACEWDGSVQGLDPTTLRLRAIATDLSRPIAIASVGDATLVLERSGRLLRLGDGVERAVSLVPAIDDERPALTKMVAHDAAALAILDGGRTVAVAFELVNPSGEGMGEPVVDDYGSVADGRPKINPSLRAFSTSDLSARATPTTYARYDAALRLRCNGPSALAVLDDGHLLVAHRSSADLATVALDADTSAARLGATWAVGAGPSGIAFDPARRIAWVDDSLDGAITRVALDGETTTRVRPLPASVSAAALEGRRAFWDATNAHLSPAGVVACVTCHPDGGDDGVVWFIRASSIVAKRRLTPHLGNAGAATAPYHWDGALPDRATLVHSTVVNLMAGDGLLVDGEAIAAYLDELVRPPVPPVGDAASIHRGAAVFDGVGCARCHPAPLFTDRQLHVVLAPEPAGPNALPMADTPSLRGLFLRAAFLHDGRSPSLRDLLSRADLEGHGRELAEADRADLIAYLRSL